MHGSNRYMTSTSNRTTALNEICFYITYSLLIITRLLSYLTDGYFSGYSTMSLLSLAIFIVLNLLIRKNVLCKANLSFLVDIFIWIFWASISSILSSASQYIPGNILTYVVFIMNIILCTRLLAFYKSDEMFFRITTVIVGSFLLWRYIADFDGLTFIKNFSQLFVGGANFERYRNAYGLYHPNATGNLCLCLILLSIYQYLFVANKKYKIYRLYVCACVIVALIMLFSSGSRASLTSLMLFVVLFLLFGIWNRSGVIWRVLQILLLVSSIVIVIYSIGISNILNETNRLYNFTHNLPALTVKHRWIMGVGLVESGFFASHNEVFNTIYVDNFYLYVLMTTGVVGLIWFFLTLAIFIKSLLKALKKSSRSYTYVCALIVVLLYGAFFETNLLYPQFISSLIYWVLLMYSVNVYAEHLNEKAVKAYLRN